MVFDDLNNDAKIRLEIFIRFLVKKHALKRFMEEITKESAINVFYYLVYNFDRYFAINIINLTFSWGTSIYGVDYWSALNESWVNFYYELCVFKKYPTIWKRKIKFI